MLVMARAQGTVLRKAQDHRNERPGRWYWTPHGKAPLHFYWFNGSRHDNYCREESGVLLTMNPKNWIGDKGYIGNNMITPFRKPAGGELLDWQKEYNSEVNKIRWMIEQVISHFKNWTIMHTDYRRPLKTFETTIPAVVGLHFYRTA